MKNNLAKLTGRVSEDIKFSHTNFDESLYEGKLSVVRRSGVEDVIPIVFTKSILDLLGTPQLGDVLDIVGYIRTNNKIIDGKSRLLTYIIVSEYTTISADQIQDSNNLEQNDIFLEGVVCKRLDSKKTYSGTSISTITLAVSRARSKSDYVPCVLWGDLADMIDKHAPVGTRLKISGRFQSREYVKEMPDFSLQQRIAYEVAVSKAVLL